MAGDRARFEGRRALITGGTSGIGERTLRRIIQEGGRAVFTGRRRERGERITRETGAAYIPADHASREGCERTVDEALEVLGRIDILFNNAGIVSRGRAEETSEEVWEETFAVNVTALWRISSLVIPHMREQGGGVIVNNASDWGLIGGRGAVAYCAAKGAVVNLTRAMALDHAREGIRVNAVCPGDTFVERWVERGDFEGPGTREEILASMGEEIPMGRVGEVEEIVEGVLFLASEQSSYMTGQMLVLDGGNTAG